VKRERVVLLGDPPPPAEEQYDWYSQEDLPNGGYVKEWREGEIRYKDRLSVSISNSDPLYRAELREKTQRSAVRQWSEIIAACKVELDEFDPRVPWDDCDGWAHEFVTDTTYWPDFDKTQMRAYVRGGCHTDAGVIRVDVKEAYLTGWEHYHDRGASKQVSRELAAQQLRTCIDQLKEWYYDGWCWYGVVGELDEYEASVWGCDNEEYARSVVVPEIAGEIAHQMAHDGWLIEGEPASSGLKHGWSRETWRKHYKDQLNLFNTESR